jgi:hypothetical protein
MTGVFILRGHICGKDNIKDTRWKRFGFGLMEECVAKVDARVQCGT